MAEKRYYAVVIVIVSDSGTYEYNHFRKSTHLSMVIMDNEAEDVCDTASH